MQQQPLALLDPLQMLEDEAWLLWTRLLNRCLPALLLALHRWGLLDPEEQATAARLALVNQDQATLPLWE